MIKNEVWYTECNKVEVRFLWHISSGYFTSHTSNLVLMLD